MGAWYVGAYCHERCDNRMFRVDRDKRGRDDRAIRGSPQCSTTTSTPGRHTRADDTRVVLRLPPRRGVGGRARLPAESTTARSDARSRIGHSRERARMARTPAGAARRRARVIRQNQLARRSADATGGARALQAGLRLRLRQAGRQRVADPVRASYARRGRMTWYWALSRQGRFWRRDHSRRPLRQDRFGLTVEMKKSAPPAPAIIIGSHRSPVGRARGAGARRTRC